MRAARSRRLSGDGVITNLEAESIAGANDGSGQRFLPRPAKLARVSRLLYVFKPVNSCVAIQIEYLGQEREGIGI